MMLIQYSSYLSCVMTKFATRLDTNLPMQPQKLARGLKFRTWVVKVLYYLCSDNKGADQGVCLRLLNYYLHKNKVYLRGFIICLQMRRKSGFFYGLLA